jgi:hypothetical protein
VPHTDVYLARVLSSIVFLMQAGYPSICSITLISMQEDIHFKACLAANSKREMRRASGQSNTLPQATFWFLNANEM